MQVGLTIEAQAAIDTLMKSGAYNSPEQVLETAIDNLLRETPDYLRIRNLVQEGADALENGDFVTREQLLHHLDERRHKRA